MDINWLERLIGRGVWGVALEYVTDHPAAEFALGALVGLVLVLLWRVVRRWADAQKRGRRLASGLYGLVSLALVAVIGALVALGVGGAR